MREREEVLAGTIVGGLFFFFLHYYFFLYFLVYIYIGVVEKVNAARKRWIIGCNNVFETDFRRIKICGDDDNGG